MVFDETTQMPTGFSTSDGTTMNEVWTWNGTSWDSRAVANGPEDRGETSVAHDPVSGLTYMATGFGVDPGPQGVLDDLWVFNGTGWSQIFGSPITPRAVASMAYDGPQRG